LGNLGILLSHMGRMNEAIACLEEARALSDSIGEIVHAAEDNYHLGIAYREIGAIQEAKAALQDSIRLANAAFKPQSNRARSKLWLTLLLWRRNGNRQRSI
jgi:tetratricopeptide (TPR) repeat protein